MRVFLMSLSAVIVIAISAALILHQFETPVSKAFATTGARV